MRYVAAARVLVMRVGPHSGETLREIFDRKMGEINDVGFCLWGYGGSIAHPLRQVQPLASDASGDVVVVFLETRSDPGVTPHTSTEFSSDGLNWSSLPTGISVTGSKWALVIDSLEEARDTYIDLGRYGVHSGPSEGKPLASYLRGRCDKACASIANVVADPHPVRVAALARLRDPFAVFVR